MAKLLDIRLQLFHILRSCQAKNAVLAANVAFNAIRGSASVSLTIPSGRTFAGEITRNTRHPLPFSRYSAYDTEMSYR